MSSYTVVETVFDGQVKKFRTLTPMLWADQVLSEFRQGHYPFGDMNGIVYVRHGGADLDMDAIEQYFDQHGIQIVVVLLVYFEPTHRADFVYKLRLPEKEGASKL